MPDSGVEKQLRFDPKKLAEAKARLATKFSTHPGIAKAIGGSAEPAEKSFARTLPEIVGATGGALLGAAGGAAAGAPLGPIGMGVGGYAGGVAGAAAGGVAGEQLFRSATGEGVMSGQEAKDIAVSQGIAEGVGGPIMGAAAKAGKAFIPPLVQTFQGVASPVTKHVLEKGPWKVLKGLSDVDPNLVPNLVKGFQDSVVAGRTAVGQRLEAIADAVTQKHQGRLVDMTPIRKTAMEAFDRIYAHPGVTLAISKEEEKKLLTTLTTLENTRMMTLEDAIGFRRNIDQAVEFAKANRLGKKSTPTEGALKRIADGLNKEVDKIEPRWGRARKAAANAYTAYDAAESALSGPDVPSKVFTAFKKGSAPRRALEKADKLVAGNAGKLDELWDAMSREKFSEPFRPGFSLAPLGLASGIGSAVGFGHGTPAAMGAAAAGLVAASSPRLAGESLRFADPVARLASKLARPARAFVAEEFRQE